MNDSSLDKYKTTRLALLGTMGPLHQGPITYDLECLRSVLLAVSPDILCAEIVESDWEDNDLTRASVEVREVLAGTTRLMDTILVPIAPSATRFEDFSAPPGWRSDLRNALDRLLTWGQRKADNPKAIHEPIFETFCHTVCILTEMTWSASEQAAWEAQNIELAEAILVAIRRDPGYRVLVAVQCQRIHYIEPELKRLHDELEMVNFWEL